MGSGGSFTYLSELSTGRMIGSAMITVGKSGNRTLLDFNLALFVGAF